MVEQGLHAVREIGDTAVAHPRPPAFDRVDPAGQAADPRGGITMSIVTRSGLSWRYFSTAWVPVSASPTTSNPACARMSVIIVRMKMASSQTRTVWLTARSLRSQNRAQQRRDVQHDEQLTIAPAAGA